MLFSIEFLLFTLFSGIAIISALIVIASVNPVHSVIFLILTFFNASGILLLLEAEFLAIRFIIVYVGAIAVLFLFVVIMLNIKISELTNSLYQYLPIGGLIGFVFLIEIFLIIDSDLIPVLSNLTTTCLVNWSFFFDQLTNTQRIGQLIYTYYFYAFILAGAVLLIALIGAIVRTLQSNNKIYRQYIYQQISRDFENAIFLINDKK
jgi:NADH-quinone oxidoreductase subunit J